MTTVTVAVLTQTSELFENMAEYAAPLLYQILETNERRRLKIALNDYLWKTIEPHVSFHEVPLEQEAFLTSISQYLTTPFPEHEMSEFHYNIQASFTSPKTILEIAYAEPIWQQKDNPETLPNTNALGCLFTLDHAIIRNTCIIIANGYDINQPKGAFMKSITREDILRVIRGRYFHSAVIVGHDSMTKMYYQKSEHIVEAVFGRDVLSEVKRLDVGLFKYCLVFHYLPEPNGNTKYVNEICTRIAATKRFYGQVLVLNELHKDVNINLSTHELRRLNVLAYGSLADRDLRFEEIDSDKCSTKYSIVEARMKCWNYAQQQCFCCGEIIISPVKCTKCYRLKFCSEKCRENTVSEHQSECLN